MYQVRENEVNLTHRTRAGGVKKDSGVPGLCSVKTNMYQVDINITCSV